MIVRKNHRHPVIQADRDVPASLRGQLIVLRFAKPVPRYVCEWFYRIRLTPELLARAEGKFHAIERFQPERRGGVCPMCGGTMVRLSPTESRCINRACLLPSGEGTRGAVIYDGPVRGVVKVLIAPEHVCGKYEFGELVQACVLALDRRYDDSVRVALWYVAGVLAEIIQDQTGADVRLA